MDNLIDRNAVEKEISKRILLPEECEYDTGYNTAMSKAKEIVENAPTVNRWIPCSDMLPEQTGYYFVCDSTAEFDNIRGRRGISKYVIGKNGGRWYGDICQKYITHWMPLPEPPEIISN